MVTSSVARIKGVTASAAALCLVRFKAGTSFAETQGVGKISVAGTEERAVSAADVNRAAMEWALRAAPEDMRKR